MTEKNYIRNFSIIAHIDHGKSTLADRILEYTKTVSPRDMLEQYLDNMDLERERGITIKAHYVTVVYKSRKDGKEYRFNLIDTPGHVDFTYEVSRSLAACEGVVLVVDATQGIQAQTLANVYLAMENDLELIPVINKIDLQSSRPEEVAEEIDKILGISGEKILKVSAKTGEGVEEILESIITDIPGPGGNEDEPLQALIFDSNYDPYRGVVSLIRLMNGRIAKNMKIRFMAEGYCTEVEEVGVMGPKMIPVDSLSAGEVGYIVTGIKEVDKIIVGDTITSFDNPTKSSLPGYNKPKPMVYCGLYPIDGDDYESLRDALKKLELNDSSLIFIPEVSVALGSGYRVGFLGLLHLEIVRERLEREYNLHLLTTTPNVVYRITKTNGEVVVVKSPADYPEEEKIQKIEEPFVTASILTPKEYIGEIMKLSNQKRGVYKDMKFISVGRVELHYDFPLSEIIVDFFNLLKSTTSGFASLDYEFKDYRASELVRLDVLVGGSKVEELSVIVHKDKAYSIGREFVRKLKQEIPRQMFEIAIQAAINKRIIARETVSALRKDVTAKLYGGDVTRKNKLLDKQKKGKKKMKKIGKVEIPSEAFMSFYKIDINNK
jgi:GTP-binding protein LepA